MFLLACASYVLAKRADGAFAAQRFFVRSGGVVLRTALGVVQRFSLPWDAFGAVYFYVLIPRKGGCKPSP